MLCPRCHNVDFQETEEIKSPVKNLGNKECTNKVDFRSYVCLQCGYAWKTEEKYYGELEIRGAKLLLDLYDAFKIQYRKVRPNAKFPSLDEFIKEIRDKKQFPKSLFE
jgi:predicted nucleic-acid-binding Zn-ribbon protein